MTDTAFAPLAITPMWAKVNDELIEMVDLVPEGKLEWSPKPELWNFKGILIHILFGRHGMMEFIVQDGQTSPDILKEAQTKDGLRRHLRRSWQRMEPFLRDASALERIYDYTFQDQPRSWSGHWLAFGQLEHDLHHRSDLYHYLGQLGVDHGEPDTLERELRARGEISDG